MSKLLKANFFRLVKDKTFLLLTVIMFAVGALLPFAHYMDSVHSGVPWALDFSFFTYAFLAPILLAVLTSLFVGNEYSNGTIRNKIIAGHRRICIYLSNLIVCIAAGIVMCAAYTVPHVCLGLLLNGRFGSPARTVILYIGLSAALITAVATLFVLIAMLCQNKAHTAAGCILLAFILLLFGVYITSSLNEPEYLPAYTYIENGVTVEEPETKNPNYVSGTKREIYEFLQDFMPGGQMLQLADMEVENPPILAVYDGIIFIAATACGIIAFKRKDLK
ncbi:MAG TPA: ABC transporter permease [Ruminococcaceae bacterium]|nr:ABC transporter permease [Oscillospiraceae bacterium]